MGPPETPSRYLQQQSPGLFPTLQLSPDVYVHQFSSGPATAPAYPNQRLLWDPSSHNGFNDASFAPSYQDPFQYSPVLPSTSFGSSSTIVPSSFAAPSLPPEQQPYALPTLPRSASYTHLEMSAFPAPFTTSPRIPTSQMENPSMFLSSPARRFGTGDQYSSRFSAGTTYERPAYAHQIEESKREAENKRLRRSEIKKPSITRSVMEALRRPVSPKRELRPGLKRSLTHTGVRSDQGLKVQTRTLADGRKSPAPLLDHNRHRPGRSSPLKSNADPVARTLNTNRPSKRGSLSLAIDENGVAKTVVTRVAEQMDLDETSESDAESFDEEDFNIIHSQSNSFAYDETARPHSSARRHSKNSSRSTMVSTGSARPSSYQSSGSSQTKATGAENLQTRRARPVLGTNAAEDTLMEEPPTGDAQQALRAIIQDRSRSMSSHGNNQMHSSPPLQQGQYGLYNVSPTTITDPDLATPSTDRDSLASSISLRCLCKSSQAEDSAPMIQW
jgi:hypothetical protein